MKTRFLRAAALLVALVTVITLIPVSAAADTSNSLGDVQGTVPDLKITVDSGYSIDTIHADKEAKIRAHVSVNGAWDSSYNMSSTGVEMKTRGNSTFGYMKKPYQIKFDSKTDMFGMGKAKKWVLLANYVDGSFIRNKIVFDLGEKIGMPYTCKSVFVNLYINGNYVGVYQLCEKVEIGDSRVPLANDMAVLAEMESAKRVAEEDFWFKTGTTGKPFVYKEYNTDFEEAPAEDVAAVRSYFESHINAIENELYNNGKDWEKIKSLIDVDSFIKFYFINELCMNVDATLASTYFYMDGPDDVLHMGPLWDYDRAFGSYDYADSGYEQGAEADFLKNIIDCSDEYRVEWFKMLFQYPEFVKRAGEIYDTVIKDAFDADRINAQIDAYQTLLYDSLMRNYVDEGWAIFHSISEAEFFSSRTQATNYLNYTVNAIKENIENRKAYLDRAYGQYHPVLSYKQNDGRTYTGGSMTDSQNMGSFTAALDTVIDGKISYTVQGSALSQSAGENGSAVVGRSLNTLAMKLEGNVANYFSVEYRVFENSAWTAWASDGAVAGATSYPITRVQARLVEKKDVTFGTVSFDWEGAESISAVVGNTVALASPVREGYTFGGWYTDAEFSGSAVEEMTVAEGETVLYAQWIKDEPEVIPLEKGDLSGDGKVNAMDLNTVKRILNGSVAITDAQREAGDVNGDGALNSVDTNVLSRYLLGYISSLG